MQRSPVIQVVLLSLAVARAGCIVAASVANASTGTAVSPLQKVVELLNDMLKKGSEEKHTEEVQYNAYKQWCTDTEAEKKKSIELADQEIEQLTADIHYYQADVAMLEDDLAEIDQALAQWSTDMTNTTEMRKIERADYESIHKEYTDALDAIQQAINILKREDYSREQATDMTPESESMLQLKGLVYSLSRVSHVPPPMQNALVRFLSLGQRGFVSQNKSTAAYEPEEANAYEFQSHGVIEILEELSDKFTEERSALEKEEMNSRHAYELVMQDLKAKETQAGHEKAAKVQTKAKLQKLAADSEAELRDTTATKEDDMTFSTELTATCQQKATDFEARQKLRTEELEALQEAARILGDATLGTAVDNYLTTSLVQATGAHAKARAVALAHLRSHQNGDADGDAQLKQRVAEFLRVQAKHFSSREISTLAQRVTEDPFDKVKQMIQDLINRLLEEAAEDSDHTAWCETELKMNEQTRTEKSEAVESLEVEIDRLKASITQLGQEVEELTASVAALDTDMAEATQLRNAEKQTNEATITDAHDAEMAVAQAMTVLKEFYAKAGQATSFAQQRLRANETQEPAQPEIFDSPYTGMQDDKHGVLGILEVIQADFAQLQSDTEAAEDASQREYDKLMSASQVDRTEKSKDIEHKTAQKQSEEQDLTNTETDLAGTQSELDAALAYYEKLKPSCVNTGDSFQERTVRRKEEIESLQEALRILNGEDLATTS